MTDQTDPAQPAAIPPLWLQIVRALAQKGLASAATALTGYGVIAPNQQSQFVSLGLGAAAWIASFAWTWVHEHHTQARLVAATNAAPPVPPATGAEQ